VIDRHDRPIADYGHGTPSHEQKKLKSCSDQKRKASFCKRKTAWQRETPMLVLLPSEIHRLVPPMTSECDVGLLLILITTRLTSLAINHRTDQVCDLLK